MNRITIYKYPMPIAHDAAFMMPKGARILQIECQMGMPWLWAVVDTDAPEETYRFKVVGTGHSIDFDLNEWHHLSTFQMDNGALVWHVYGEAKEH